MGVCILFERELRTAYDLPNSFCERAQAANDPALLLFAHFALGDTSFKMGELLLAREHLEMAISSMIVSAIGSLASRFVGVDAEVNCLGYSGHDSVEPRLPGPGSQAGQ